MRLVLVVAALAAVAAVPAAAQDTEERPFAGPYVGVALGYAFQPNDGGERLLFDRGFTGNFNQNVTTATGANAFSPGFCNGTAISTANIAVVSSSGRSVSSANHASATRCRAFRPRPPITR